MADNLKIKINIDFNHLDAEMKKMQQKIQSKDINLNTKNLDKSIKNISNSTKDASKNMTLFGASIFDAAKKFSEWYLLGNVISSVFSSIRQGFADVYELDTALTNVTFTMDLTTEQIQEMSDNSFELAQSLNTSVHEVMVANQVYSNLSETLESINQKTETTIALANLTGSSVSTMADSLQGLLYQFNLGSDSVGDLSDALVSIAATTGVEFNKSVIAMSDAVSKAGSTASEAGFSYSQFLATIATLNQESRLAGSTLAAGLTTVLSRMNRVSTASAEEISRVETALRKVGVQLRDSNGEFRNSFDVLQDTSKVYKNLNSVQKNELAFLLAGTRQRRIFVSLMGSFNDIVERSEIALNSEGETMRLNEKYADSLKGTIADLTNSLQEMYTTIIKTDALKYLIEGFTGFIDFITSAIKNIDILIPSIVSLASVFVAFKSTLISTALVGTAVFAPQIVAVALALGGLAAITAKYKSDLKETTQVAEQFNEKQQELNDIIESGNKREMTIRLEKLKELKEEYDEAKKTQDEFADSINYDNYGSQAQSAQIKLTTLAKETEKTNLELKKLGATGEDVGETIENLESKIKNTAEEFDNTGRIVYNLDNAYQNFTNSMNNGIDSLKGLNSAIQDVTENEDYNKETILELAEQYPQLLGVLGDREELEKTLIGLKNEQLEQTKIGLQRELEFLERALESKAKIYGLEIDMIDTVNQTRLGFAAQQLSKASGTIGLTKAQNELMGIYDTAQKVQDARRFLDGFDVNFSNIGFNSKSSSSGTQQKINENERYKTLLWEVRDAEHKAAMEREKLNDESLDKIPILMEINELTTKQQQWLQKLNNERRAEMATLDESSDRYQELKGVLQQTSLEWWKLDNQMRSNLQTMTEINKTQITEFNNNYKEDVKNYIEAEREKFDEFKRKKEKRLEELKDEMTELDRMYEDTEYVETQEDLDDQIRKLEEERTQWIGDKSQESKKRQWEIEQELVRLRQEQDKQERKREYDLDKRKLEDKKEVINDELREREQAMNDKVNLLEKELETMDTLLTNFTSNWQLYGTTWGEALANGLIPQLQPILDMMNEISGGKLNMKVPTSSSSSGGSTTKNSSNAILDKMAENSRAWHTATESEKKRLEAENKSLGKSIGASYDPSTGKWDKLKYHVGGVAGKDISFKELAKNNEVLSILEKDEIIIPKDISKNILNNNILPKMNIPKIENPLQKFKNEIKSILTIEKQTNIINNDYDVRKMSQENAKYLNRKLLREGLA